MLIIDSRNLNFITQGWFSLREVLNRFTTARLDVDAKTLNHLLESGQIDQIHKYGNWSGMRASDLPSDLSTLSRAELKAVLRNHAVANIAIKEKSRLETELPLAITDAIYANITVDDAVVGNVELSDVLHNPFTSSRVKYALIDQAFKAGKLPVTTEEELKKYSALDMNPKVAAELRNIGYSETLIAPELLRGRSLRKYRDVIPRCALSLAGKYDSQSIVLALENDSEFEMCDVLFSNLKGPNSVQGTINLLERMPRNRHAATYIAANGRLGKTVFKEVMDFVLTNGNEADVVTLYQNPTMTAEMRHELYDHVSVSVVSSSYRHMLFGKFIEECDKRELGDFCDIYSSDSFMFYYLQTPEAYRRSAIYAIHHCSQCTIGVDEILTKCVDLSFDDKKASDMLDIIVGDRDYDAATRFLITDGIPYGHKVEVFKKLA